VKHSRTGSVLGAVPSAAAMGAHKKVDAILVVALKTRGLSHLCTFFLKKVLTTFFCRHSQQNAGVFTVI